MQVMHLMPATLSCPRHPRLPASLSVFKVRLRNIYKIIRVLGRGGSSGFLTRVALRLKHR
jgi:hypothetical protein